MRASTAVRSVVSLLLLVSAVACTDHASPTAPRSLSAPQLSSSRAKDGKKVAVCKPQKESWASSQIGSKGGRVEG
ncbi:MAG: hypothetical protein ABIQ10_08925 [Gemmatimonadaceae bacterium]